MTRMLAAVVLATGLLLATATWSTATPEHGSGPTEEGTIDGPLDEDPLDLIYEHVDFVEKVRALLGSRYGTIYKVRTASGVRLVVSGKGMTSSEAASIREALPRAMSLKTVDVPASRRDLEVLKAALAAELSSLGVREFGIGIRYNRVHIDQLPGQVITRGAQKALADFALRKQERLLGRSTLAPLFAIKRGNGSARILEDPHVTYAPLRAAKWLKVDSGVCTAGFMIYSPNVVSGTHYRGTTAGHCGYVGDLVETLPLTTDGPGGRDISNINARVACDGCSADVAFYPVPDANALPRILLADHSSRDVLGRRHLGQLDGLTVCTQGAGPDNGSEGEPIHREFRCADIVDTDYDGFSPDPGPDTDDLVCVDGNINYGGDSGGPWYDPSGSDAYAVGITTGRNANSQSCFSAIGWVLSSVSGLDLKLKTTNGNID